jgi:mRNA interferase MazF
VLVPFPFTDLSGQKVRPAAIISPDPIGEDILLAFISSVIPAIPDPTEHVLGVTYPAFAQTGLRTPAVFKMSKLVTLHRSVIFRRLGRVSLELQAVLDAKLRRAVGLT